MTGLFLVKVCLKHYAEINHESGEIIHVEQD